MLLQLILHSSVLDGWIDELLWAALEIPNINILNDNQIQQIAMQHFMVTAIGIT
jgi:hypothetical protein